MGLIAALVGFLFAGIASAQPLTGATFRDFSGGYVDSIEPTNLQPNQSPSALNVVVDDPIGSIRPRNGLALCGNTPSGNAPTNLYKFSRSEGTNDLIVTDNLTVWSTRDCRTFTTIVTGLAAAAQIYFTTARDKLWIVNGSTWPYTWDGTTATILDGRANTPTSAPKCAYPEFWRERIWCARTSANASIIHFTDLTDTNGNDIDPSTHTASFPATSAFQIDQNGGSPIYGIRAYRDRLYVFKDNGIWEIQFNSEFENSIRKTGASVGSRFNDSIREVDGILYFVGKDGIYGFNGDEAVLISANIENRFRSLNQPLMSQNQKIWTTAADFLGGTLVNVSTSVTVGSLVIPDNAVSNSNFEDGNTAGWTTDQQSISAGACNNAATIGVSAVAPIAGTYSGYIFGQTCQVSTTIPGECESRGTLTYRYSLLDGAGTVLIGPTTPSSSPVDIDLTGQATNYFRLRITDTLGQSTFTLNAGIVASRTLRFSYTTAAAGICAPNGGGGSVDFKFDAVKGSLSTGSFTSDIYNTVAVSTWGAFNVSDAPGLGSISYEIRYGTDTGATQSMAFAAITPGSIIPASTDKIYIQVKAKLSPSSDYFSSPEFKEAEISWNSGGLNTQQIHAGGWKNALWISASSGSATTNNVTLVKSRLPAASWMPYDLQIGPMTVFNDYFYVGASTHGAIYRADYGTNDDGRAIPWYWDTRDELWNEPNRRKYLQEITTDFKKGTATNAYVGWSYDYGESFTTKTVDMNGSGRGSYRAYVNGGLRHSYRFRVGSNTLNETATVTGITGWARPSTMRE